MKERVRLEDQFVNSKGPTGETDQAHLDDAKCSRHCHFAEMKSEAGGNIEIGIDVMHVVKTPEKWDAMIGDVPIIEGEVHQEKAERELERRRQRHQMDHAKSLRIRPMQRRLCRSE